MVKSDGATNSYNLQSGFVLPSVLAYIAAALALVSIGALALQRAQNNTNALRVQAELTQALDDAEAELLFAYLSARSVPYGLVEGGDGFDLVDSFMTDEPVLSQSPSSEAIWRADGSRLRLELDDSVVLISYRDVSGLISLNTASEELISVLLVEYGVDRDEAQSLAAKLADYIDEDTLRRPRGAERADYRLRQLVPPTNSPLRSLSEASDVLGWDSVSFLSDPRFLNQVTIAMIPSEPNPTFASEETRALLSKVDRASFSDRDALSEAIRASLLPSSRGRFKLQVFDRQSFESKIRVIEVERTVGALNAPFSRLLISERSVGAINAADSIWSSHDAFPNSRAEASSDQ